MLELLISFVIPDSSIFFSKSTTFLLNRYLLIEHPSPFFRQYINIVLYIPMTIYRHFDCMMNKVFISLFDCFFLIDIYQIDILYAIIL